MAYLNSRLSVFTASLALVSLADARSQTSKTSPQSSDAVAVKYPRSDSERVRDVTQRPTNHLREAGGGLIIFSVKISPPVPTGSIPIPIAVPAPLETPEGLLVPLLPILSRIAHWYFDSGITIFRR